MASAGELLSAGVRALTWADAAELERLAAMAEKAVMPETAAERRAVAEQHRTLGHLLRLTRQNLRILQAALGVARGYGTGRS